VTLAFMPYGAEVEHLAARARAEGHEILLQIPMEPFNYPDNDPGPQTLLTSLTPEQNLERLYWLMSRMQGYVGLAEAMGARFTASEPSFGPILRETAKRGLIFVDDGANPRSVAARIAGANNLPFAKADVVLDVVPTPDEVERALARLEMTARERSVAVGIASALPVSLEHIGKWARAAESRGLLLVPITAVVMKDKQSWPERRIAKWRIATRELPAPPAFTIRYSLIATSPLARSKKCRPSNPFPIAAASAWSRSIAMALPSSAGASTVPSTPMTFTSGRCRKAASIGARTPGLRLCASFARRPTSRPWNASARSRNG